jgi:hypothetical protein
MLRMGVSVDCENRSDAGIVSLTLLFQKGSSLVGVKALIYHWNLYNVKKIKENEEKFL